MCKLFKDTQSREWLVEINVAQLRRLRDLHGVDLLSLLDDGLKALSQLLMDPCKLVDVLYVLCQGQAKELGVGDEDFGRAMGGDALQDAAEALTEELFDFFPNRQARESLRKAAAAQKELARHLVAQGEEQLLALDLKEEAAKILAAAAGRGDSSGSAPGSPESTPALSR